MAQKTSADFEKEFVDNIVDKTGKSLAEWMAIVESSGHAKNQAILKHLKAEYPVNHMQANFLANIYLNGGKPLFGDESALFDALFKGKEAQRPIFEAVKAQIEADYPSVAVVPTKAYISFRNEREFAVAKIMKKLVRVGMDLGPRPFDEYVQKAKSLGTMPRIGHMVEIEEPAGVNDTLRALLAEANHRVNA